MGDDECSDPGSVKLDNEFFKRMLDFIPASDYFDLPTQQKIKSQAEKTGTSSSGENAKKRKKGKKRQPVVNPVTVKSVSQLQDDLGKCQDVASEDEGFTKVKPKPAQTSAPASVPSMATYTTLSAEDKRALLRAKIEALKAKRNCSQDEKQEQKRLKRKEHKLKQKAHRKEMKQNKKKGLVPGQTVPGSSPAGKQRPTLQSPVRNSEGEMVFSKFDFTPKHKDKSDLTGKDYKRLLEKIEKRNEKIKKLKTKDESAAKALTDKFKWESALHKAEGVKVKDNPELLKKAMKKKEKMKEQKKKKWTEREETVKKTKEAKQEKRKKNIQSRKQAKVDKKIKKAKKKGRIVPGF